MRLIRPFKTRFRCGSIPEGLNLATYINSLAHYAKGTPSGIVLADHSPSTACGHTVSGTISLPSPGYFSPFPHGTGSLSVVSLYLALGGGPPGFPRGFTCPAVLGYPARKSSSFNLRGYHPLWQAFPDHSTKTKFCNFPARLQTDQARTRNTGLTTPVSLR
jgi:hypothetical protein